MLFTQRVFDETPQNILRHIRKNNCVFLIPRGILILRGSYLRYIYLKLYEHRLTAYYERMVFTR